MNLTVEWERLEGDTRIAEVSGRVQRRIGSTGRRNFFLGLEMPSRNRMLVFRVSEQSLEGQPSIPDSRGLSVRVTRRDTGGREAEVELILRDSQHRDLFDLLVRDLVEAAERPEDERSGLTGFLSRLSNWQELLRRLAPAGLSREGQQGLWGELWVLGEVVAPVSGMENALNAWRGPLGADQDFQTGTACIEVKTSTAHGPDRLPMASERQLDVPADMGLFLVVLSLDSRAGYGRTLPEMVEGARAAAAGSGSLHLLNERLDLCGYEVDDAGLYADVGYGVRSFRAFVVGEGFPRIVPGDLASGVGEVRYSVSMAACAPFCHDVERPDDLLRGLV